MQLYDTESGQLVRTLTGGYGKMFTPAMSYGKMLWFSPNGSAVIASPLQDTIKVWSVKDGSLQAEFAARGVTSFLLTEDGRAAISAHNNGSLIVRCLAGNGAVLSLQGHDASIATLVADPSHRLLVTGAEDRTARLWEMPKGSDVCDLEKNLGKNYDRLSVRRPVAVLAGHGAFVTNAVFSPDDRLVVTASRDGWVRAWTIAPDLVEIDGLPIPEYGDPAPMLSRDGQTLIAVRNGKTQAWNVASGKPIAIPEAVNAVAISPDGSLMVDDTTFGDKPMVLVDRRSNKTVARLIVGNRAATAFYFSPDGSRLLGRLADKEHTNGGLAVWDTRSGNLVAVNEMIPGYGFDSVITTSASGERILIMPLRPPRQVAGLGLFEIVGDKIKALPFRALSGSGRGISAAAISADGSKFVTGYVDGTIAIVDIASNTLQRVFDMRGVSVVLVTTSPDGRYLAAMDKSSTLWIFEITSGELVKTRTFPNAVSSIQFFPASDRVLVLGEGRGSIVKVLPDFEGRSDARAMIDLARKRGLNLVPEIDRRRFKLGSNVKTSKRWAALDPDSEVTAPVVWADSNAEVVKKAVDACKKISKTCGTRPAVTQDMDATFVYMCCRQPRRACAVYAGSGDTALLSAKRILYQAGFSSCAVESTLAARDGSRE